MVAAGFKVYTLWVAPLELVGVGVALVALGEWLLGCWILSGHRPSLSSWVATATFAVFAGVSLVSVLRGRTSCGCLGFVEVPPMVMLVLDVLMVVTLVLFRPATGPVRAAPSRVARRRLAAALAGVGMVGLPLSLLVAATPPGKVDDAGQIVGTGKQVLLEPEAWKGKRFPLADHIETTEKLMSGQWQVVLYHHDCPDCLQAIAKLRQRAERRELTDRVVLVEAPPFGPEAKIAKLATPGFARGKLKADRDWLFYSPAMAWLEDGRVVRIQLAPDAPTTTPAPAAPSTPSPPSAPVPVVATDQPGIDLGYVEPGARRTIEFKVANASARSLKIVSVRTECDCLQPMATPPSIPPKGSATIRADFKAFNEPSDYAKRLILTTDDPARGVITLEVKCAIGIPLVVEPARMDLGPVEGSAEISRPVALTNRGGKPVRLLFATCALPGLTALVPREPVAPGATLQLPLVITPGELKEGTREASVEIRTDSKEQAVVSVRVRYARPEPK